MKKIPSFSIDHIHLLRGIYVSRKDYLGDQVVTTFDIRMKEPNREPALGYGELHTIEHLAATYLRNHPVCAHCGRLATEVDHVIPFKGDKARIFDLDNLQPLCHERHSKTRVWYFSCIKSLSNP